MCENRKGGVLIIYNLNQSLNWRFETGNKMMQRVDQENLSFSQQNILANSIRIVRQRFGKVEQAGKSQSRAKDSHNQTFTFSNNNRKECSAAMAIKALHSRISELEAFNAQLARQLSFAKRENNFQSSELQSLRIESSNFQVKIGEYKEQLAEAARNLKEKKDQLEQRETQLEEERQQWTKQLAQKQQKFQQSSRMRQILEEKTRELNKRIENNQKLIVQMIKELEEQKEKNSTPTSRPAIKQKKEANKCTTHKDYDTFPIILDEPEDSQILKSQALSLKKWKNSKNSLETRQANRSNRIENNQLSNKELEQKNKQLYIMLRTCDRKYKHEQKLKNEYRDRFYALKEAIDSMVEEINKLPNNISHKFKCLIIKVRKVEQDNLECLVNYPGLHRNRLYSKSSRHSSNSGSKSKQKQLKMEDLNFSDPDIQSQSRSKSKRKLSPSCLANQSATKRESPMTEKAQARELNKKIRKQRKEMCQIYRRVRDEKDPEKEQKLKNQLQEKIALNTELQQLRNYKRSIA